MAWCFLGGEDTADGGWVSSPKRAVVFFGGGIEDIDAIEDMGFWGCGLGGMEEIKKSASPKKKPLRGKKVGSAEKKLRLWLAGQYHVWQRWQVGACNVWDHRQETMRPYI